MKVWINLVEYVALNGDGTATLVRVGLDTIPGGKPDARGRVRLTVWVAVQFRGEQWESGDHAANITLEDQDGKVLVGPHETRFHNPGAEATHIERFALGVLLPPGRYTVKVYVEGKVADRLGFDATAAEPPQVGE